jgi:cytochrome b561
MQPSSSDRYDRFAVFMHWLIAVLVVGQFVFGWWMQEIPKQPPGPRAEAFNLHKSVGLTILALMLVRVLWRASHRPPPLPTLPAWQARLASLTHVGIYALLLLLPLAGYFGSVFSGYPVKFFGVTLPAWGSRSTGLKDLFSALHLVGGTALAALVVLHVAAALKHAFIDRDGLLSRMGLRGRTAVRRGDGR